MVTGIIIAAFYGCKKYYAEDAKDDGGSGGDGSEAVGDYEWNESDVVSIVLNGTSVTENSDSVTVDGEKVTIIGAGTYRISGSLTNGQIIVEAKGKTVKLLLHGVNITCSNNAPVFIQKAEKAIIILEDGTANYLTDGSSYVLDSDGDPNAALFSKSYLAFSGNGSLTVKASYNDGITGKDGLVINAGTFNVTATDDGISGKDYLFIHEGKITVSSGGDGMKSDNEEDTSLGYVTIESGTYNIVSEGDGISAITKVLVDDGTFNIETGGGATAKGGNTPGGGGGGGGTSGGYTGTVSAKGIKGLTRVELQKGTYIINAADDGLHSNNAVVLNGGDITISSGDDGIHADESIVLKADNLNILTCYEGIESASIDFVSGQMSLVSTDDGFNATMGSANESNDGSILKIEGGKIVINSSTGDAIDSNGSATMTGGTLIANGPQSSPEVGIDVNGTFNISGGMLLATGPNSGNMIEATSSSSSQYAVMATIQSTLSSSSLFHIEDSEGKELITYKPVRSIYYVVFSSSDLQSGSTYRIYTGGSYSGTFANGYYSGGTYSGGTLKKEFTLSGKVTGVSF